MRLIDADSLKDTVEYCLLQHEDTEKWVEWFNQVIDAEETIMELTSNTDDVAVNINDFVQRNMGDIGYIFGYAVFGAFLLGVLVGYLISQIKENK